MGRYIEAGMLEGDARLRLFPEGHCQWCSKELPKRCKVFCPGVSQEYYPGGRSYKMQVCANQYHWYWYTTPRYRRLVLLRDDFTCQQCGLRPTVVWPDGIERPDLSQLHADHIVPYSRGGRNHLENLQLLCATCNLKKGAKMPEETALTGYWHASDVSEPIPSDEHGHYTEDHRGTVPVVHNHKGGRRAHFHGEGDTNGDPNNSQ